MKNLRALCALTVFLASPVLPSFAGPDKAADIYEVMGLGVDQVLSGTVLQSKVLPGGEKQTVALATFYTGRKNKSDALNTRLAVFAERDGKPVAVYERNFGEERGGFVGRADLQLIDLDRDGVNEIVVSYENVEGMPLIQELLGEVILWDGTAFRPGWSGVMQYDATRAARDVPAERRDRFEREIDVVETMRTRGVTLFMNKTVRAVAGESLPQPKTVRETFPLREAPAEW